MSDRGNPQNLTSKGHRWEKGQSGNPSGRVARVKTMFTDALREKLAALDMETKQTVAGRLADILIRCATDPDPEVDKTRIMALAEIVDRVEGRPKQQLDVNDVTADLRSRTTEDLVFHLEHGYW